MSEKQKPAGCAGFYRLRGFFALRLLLPLESHHFAVANLQAVEVIGPCGHHLSTLGQPLRAVVGGARLAALFVGKLQLDQVGRVS